MLLTSILIPFVFPSNEHHLMENFAWIMRRTKKELHGTEFCFFFVFGFGMVALKLEIV